MEYNSCTCAPHIIGIETRIDFLIDPMSWRLLCTRKEERSTLGSSRTTVPTLVIIPLGKFSIPIQCYNQFKRERSEKVRDLHKSKMVFLVCIQTSQTSCNLQPRNSNAPFCLGQHLSVVMQRQPGTLINHTTKRPTPTLKSLYSSEMCLAGLQGFYRQCYEHHCEPRPV